MPSSTTPSESQIEANRRNAQLSTGPRTPEGKARVSKNRTTHALTGAHTILATEDPAHFACLLAALVEEHGPATETEAHQVEILAHNQWKLRRAARLEAEAFSDSLSAATGRVTLTDAVMRAARYQASTRRSYTLALAELHRLRSARARLAQLELARALDAQIRRAQSARNDSNPISPASGNSGGLSPL